MFPCLFVSYDAVATHLRPEASRASTRTIAGLFGTKPRMRMSTGCVLSDTCGDADTPLRTPQAEVASATRTRSPAVLDSLLHLAALEAASADIGARRRAAQQDAD